MVAGGQACDTMGASFQAGASVVGAGFDLSLKGMDADIDVKAITSVVRTHLETAQAEQATTVPDRISNSHHHFEVLHE
jgi:hypothetical protein